MPITAVAIGIILRDGHILICRRRKDSHLGGLWEFPGGKCEPHESPTDCLRRELLEEVGVTVESVHAFTTIEYHYPARIVRLHPFLCHVTDGVAAPHASDELRWVPVAELHHHEFPPANDPLLKEVVQHLQVSRAAPTASTRLS